MNLGIHRNLMTVRLRKLGFDFTAEKEIDELAGAGGVGAAANDGHGIGYEQRAHSAFLGGVPIGKDNSCGFAGADLADSVVGIRDANSESAFADAFGHLLVSRNDVDAVVFQASIELLSFFCSQDFEQAGGLGR